MSADEEKGSRGRQRRPKGYPSLADIVSQQHGDNNIAIYAHFDDLAARNLLYLQAELAELRALQNQCDQEDSAIGQIEAKERARNWKEFKRLAEEPDGGQREKDRMKLMLRIRSTLKEYRETLLQEAQISSFRRPTKQAHAALRQILFPLVDEEEAPLLWDDSMDIYRERHDLIALARPAEEDRLTMVLRKYVPFLFPGRAPRAGPIASFSNDKIRRVVAIISFCVAAALLYGAILNFYFVRDEHTVLGLIAVYTIAFALSIGLLTNAKRSEIFAACSAYAAVIVVFISNPLGNPETILLSGVGVLISRILSRFR